MIDDFVADFENSCNEEIDALGFSDRLKACAEFFFKSNDEYKFEDIEYRNGYFLSSTGTNSKVIFHIKECPGWLFGIWWDIPIDKDDNLKEFRADFFTQYEDEIDKFKPYASTFCTDLWVNLDATPQDNEFNMRQARKIIGFIHKDPALAFCREYFGYDYNLEHHTREEAQDEFEKYLERKETDRKYTKICDDMVLEFVRDNIMTKYVGAEMVSLGEDSYPKYRVVVPIEKNPEVEKNKDVPGLYSMFEDDDVENKEKYENIIEECERICEEHGVFWSAPIKRYIMFKWFGGEQA